MKYLFLLLPIFVYANSSLNSLVKHLNNLSWDQSQVLAKTKHKGDEFDYGLTLSAIAWQESNFGKWKINLMDPSCGVFHIMPKFMDTSKWRQSRLCERLISDYDFSFSTALQQLKYWENYWRSKHVSRVWSHTVCSYNSGFRFNSNSQYLHDIKIRIRALKIYFNKGVSK